MASITLSVELPEGVLIDTYEYRASHQALTNEFGAWSFQPADGGEPVELTGELLTVVDELPAGRWSILP